MTLDFIDYQDGETILRAAIARPAADGLKPCVMVAHQWAGRGHNEHRVAERLAELGYVGIAIDLFGKDVEGSLTADNSHLIAPFLSDRALLARRMEIALAFARKTPGVDPARVAALGFCFGGLAVLDLARTGTRDLAAAISVHGILAGHDLPVSGPIAAQILLHHGWRDPMAPPDAVVAFGSEMQARDADWQLHAHGRALHAFTTHGVNAPDHGVQHDPVAEARTWASIEVFLKALF